MSSVSYLPHVSPKDNNTHQIRRRVNDIVSAVTVQSEQISTLQQPAAPNAPTPPTTIESFATGGTATALPANPAAYEVVVINGIRYKRPLFYL